MATYTELATLVNSSTFADRVKFAVAFFARYILNEDPGASNHRTRSNWAKGAYTNPGGVATGFLPAIALDSTIQTNLAASTDAQVQAATEAVINTSLNF